MGDENKEWVFKYSDAGLETEERALTAQLEIIKALKELDVKDRPSAIVRINSFLEQMLAGRRLISDLFEVRDGRTYLKKQGQP